MNQIIYTFPKTEADFENMLALQKTNLPENISIQEAEEQGFVTLKHNVRLLQEMNNPFPHAIAKDGERVVGYALVMLKEFSQQIPKLDPMFAQIEDAVYQSRKLNSYKYFIMGQVCIDKAYRGKRIFDNLYLTLKAQMEPHFDFVLTEVATRNVRSMKAHQRVGFQRVHLYNSPSGEEWEIILWNWK